MQVVGAPVATVDCKNQLTPTGPEGPVEGAIQEYIICPVPDYTSMSAGLKGGPYPVVLSSGTPEFTKFTALMSEPDGSPTPGQACPMYADVMRLVYARSTTGIWSLHIPVDSCHHYQSSVQQFFSEMKPTMIP